MPRFCSLHAVHGQAPDRIGRQRQQLIRQFHKIKLPRKRFLEIKKRHFLTNVPVCQSLRARRGLRAGDYAPTSQLVIPMRGWVPKGSVHISLLQDTLLRVRTPAPVSLFPFSPENA
jgi:hypothetical protein